MDIPNSITYIEITRGEIVHKLTNVKIEMIYEKLKHKNDYGYCFYLSGLNQNKNVIKFEIKYKEPEFDELALFNIE